MKKKVLIVSMFTLMNTAMSWSQNIGLLTNTPDAPVHIASSGQLNIPGGLLLLGNRFEGHLEMDFDILQAKYDQSPLALKLQPIGGHVGINSMSPSAPLHIASSGQVNTPGGLLLMGDRNEGHMEIDFDIIQSRYGFSGQTLPLRLQPSGGKTGINTYSPQAILHVWSNGTNPTPGGLFMLGNSTERNLRMDYDMIQVSLGMLAQPLKIQPLGGNIDIGDGHVFINQFLNRVGILDATPDYTLDVAGTVGVQEYIYHKGELDTYFRFNDDRIRAIVGGKEYLDMIEGAVDIMEIGDGSMDIRINESIWLEGNDKQVAIGNVGNPDSRLHIRSTLNEGSLHIENNGDNMIHIKPDKSIVIGGFNYVGSPSLKSNFPMEILINSAPARPALNLVGIEFDGEEGGMTGGTLSIGLSSNQMLFDPNEIQCYNNSSHASLPLFINRRGGNIILGKNTISRVGVNVLNDVPASDFHVYQSFSSNFAQSGITLESPYGDDWRMAVGGSGELELYFEGTLKALLSNVNGTWSAPSDSTLKKDIVSLGPVLDKVNQLRPVQYHMLEQNTEDPHTNGFIAQEVQSIFPDMVIERNGTLAVRYEQFAVLAIASIQELTTQNISLEKQLSSLELALQNMEQKLENLEGLFSTSEKVMTAGN